MTRNEVKKIVMIIASTYPNWHPSDMSLTVDAWMSMLESFTYQDISSALKAYIVSDTNGFAPAPGQITGLLDRIVQKVVGAPSQLRNWSQTDSESVENVIQSNFMRAYRYEVAKNIFALLPNGTIIF